MNVLIVHFIRNHLVSYGCHRHCQSHADKYKEEQNPFDVRFPVFRLELTHFYVDQVFTRMLYFTKVELVFILVSQSHLVLLLLEEISGY